MKSQVITFFTVIIVLIGCSSELKTENEALKGQIAELQSQIDALKNAAPQILTEAITLQKQGSYRQAWEKYKKVIDFYPTSPEAREADQRLIVVSRILAGIAQGEAKKRAEILAQEKRLTENIISSYDEMKGITWYYDKDLEEVKWNLPKPLDHVVCVNKVCPYIGKQGNNVWMRFKCYVSSFSGLSPGDEIIFLSDGKRFVFPVDFTDVRNNTVDMGLNDDQIIDLAVIACGNIVKVRFRKSTRYDFELTEKQKKGILTITNLYARMERQNNIATTK